MNAQPDMRPQIVGGLLYGADRQVGRWIADRIEGYSYDPWAPAIGVVRDRRLVAGASYDRFNGVHVEASIAAEPGSRWANRTILRGLFAYPFLTLGCEAISVIIPMSNVPSLRLARGLGFRGEAIIRLAAHDGGDLVILKMFRDGCKWIDRHGQEGRRKRTEISRPG